MSSGRVRAAGLFGLGLALLLLVVFADPLLSRRSFAGRDFVRFFLPVEKAIHDAWARGRVPVSMPEASFGRVLAANPNSGVFYPVRLALAALPLEAALKAFPVVHLWLAGVGAFVLAQSLGASAAGGTVAGLVYALSGPALSDVDFPNVVPGFALLPWVVAAAAALARRDSRRAVAAFGLLWGLDLLAGDVFTAGLALIAAALVVLQERRNGGAPGSAGRLAAAAAVGLVVASVQLVPTALFFPWSVRALTKMSIGAATEWSLSPWRFAELAVPFPFGRGAVVWGQRLWSGHTSGFFASLYPGAFAAAALAGGLLPRRNRIFLYGFLAAGTVLAAAGFFVPESLLGAVSPIPLRYPEKFAVAIVLVAAVAAGLALDRYRESGAGRAWILPLAIGVLLRAAGAAAAHDPAGVASLVEGRFTPVRPLADLAAERLPDVLAAASAAWLVLAGLLFLWEPGRRRALTAAATLFVVVDLGILAGAIVATEPSALVLDASPMARRVRRADGGSAFRFVPLGDYVFPSHGADPFNEPYDPATDRARRDLTGLTGAAFGVSYAFNIDYDRSDFFRVELARRELLRDGAAWPGAPAFLAAFSGRTAVVERDAELLGFSRRLGDSGRVRLVADPSALPSVRFVRDVRETADLAETYGLIHARAVDLARETVVETGASRVAHPAEGVLRAARADGDRLELEVDAAGPARLLVARASSPFSAVLLDGHSWPAEPANLCLTSIAVPAGTHRVSFRERVPGGAAGLVLSLAGAAAVLGLALREGRLSRRGSSPRGRPASPPAPPA
ncbi:MAG TPA: hypothetical protein VMN82_15640 [Thermoanaerobaculia bacterium]|nr:hypothetical protein [Thermoanaerobaculia bacterium]